MDYKVKNVSGHDIYINWNEDLFSEETLAEWKDYQKTTEYLGDSPEQIAAYLRQPPMIRLQQWVNDRQMGVLHFSNYVQSNGIRMKVPEYKMVFRADEERVMDERQVKYFKRLERHEIPQRPDDKSLHGVKMGPVYEGLYQIEAVEKIKLEVAHIARIRMLATRYGLKFTPRTTKAELIRMIQDYEGAESIIEDVGLSAMQGTGDILGSDDNLQPTVEEKISTVS